MLLEAHDADDDAAHPNYDPAAPRMRVRVTRLPRAADCVLLQPGSGLELAGPLPVELEVEAAAGGGGGPGNWSVRVRPALHAFSGDGVHPPRGVAPLCNFSYEAVDGVTGEVSARRGTVRVYVEVLYCGRLQ